MNQRGFKIESPDRCLARPPAFFATGKSLLLLVLLLLMAGAASAGTIHFTVLHTSDEHSSLMPTPLVDYLPGKLCPATGGFARLATLVEQVRRQKGSETVLLLSSGDFSGGTPFAWPSLSGQAVELELMKKIGYNATITGNHEFDYGPENLARRLNSPAPPVLSSNMIIPDQHPMKMSPIRQNLLIEVAGGLKIGIFALLGKDAHRLAPTARPLDVAEQQATARREIAALHQAGASIIIALTHAGYHEDVSLAQNVTGIHLILGGHDHLSLKEPQRVNDALLMHSGSYLQTLGQLDLAYDTATSRLSLRNQTTGASFLHRLDSQIPENPEIAALTARQLLELDELLASSTDGAFTSMQAPVARSSMPLVKHQSLCETTIGNFSADAMRFAVARTTGRPVDFALHANGIIRGDITPSTMASNSGVISLFDLVTTACLGEGSDGRPGYPLVSFYVTGAEMRNLLEVAALLPILWSDVYFLQFSGLRYWYDPDRAVWLRIPFINKPWPAYRAILRAERYTGSGYQQGDAFAPLEDGDNRLYHVATTHYMASYLPMVGKRLPRLQIVLKDQLGKPIDLAATLIKNGSREYKLWEALLHYTSSFATDSSGLPMIPDYYHQSGNRIIRVAGPSLWRWPAVVAILLLAAAIYLVRRRQLRSR